MTSFKSDRSYSLLDIAPTAAQLLGVRLPFSDGQAIDLVEGWGCRNAAIIIVDSLGYDLMIHLLHRMENAAQLIDEGLLLRARAVSNQTTPAIASILSGLLPEHHQIFDKAGAKASKHPQPAGDRQRCWSEVRGDNGDQWGGGL